MGSVDFLTTRVRRIELHIHLPMDKFPARDERRDTAFPFAV